MGLGQTLLTILSLVIMGRIILSMNTTTLDTGMMKDLAEYRIVASSYGVSRLENIESQRFDERSEDELKDTSVVSFSSRFGPGKDSVIERGLDRRWPFDDVDDYHGFDTTLVINGVEYKDSTVVTYDSLNYVTGRIFIL